jgi:signal transduction histidine kinase/FixJ family two-component response regulator
LNRPFGFRHLAGHNQGEGIIFQAAMASRAKILRGDQAGFSKKFMRRFGNKFYKTIVIIWLTLSIGSVLLAGLSWWNLTTSMKQGRKLTAIRDDLDSILKSLLDAETGARGYVITGDPKFLEPFNSATNSLDPEFDHLVTLVAGDMTFIKTVTDMRGEAALVIGWQQQIIAARSRSFNKAAELVTTGQSKEVMDTIRSEMNALGRRRTDQLLKTRQELNAQVSRASLTSLGAGAAGIGAGIFAFWLTQLALRQQKRERELTEAKLHAEHSNKEKTVFLANMSHEIRTPMNAILGFSELLQNDLREPKHRQYLQFIRSSAGSLLLLINDILDMSKIEAGVMELHPEPTDLREICDFVHALFVESAAKKNLRLTCAAVENLPHALLLDRIRLRQILINLVGNAVKFTDKGGVEINVTWEKQETSSHVLLVIEVLDTGVGIPQDKLDAIFKPFVQAGAHVEKEKQGTGLGLSIVKRLTEIMGGTVTVASVMGQGSAFHLRFPNVPISARRAMGEKNGIGELADFNELRASTLLVVDDNETNCRLIAGMFTGSHHRLVFGSNGLEAVAKAREIKPDVLLLDVRMPGMDGYQALEEIRKTRGLEFLPVIAVTASNLKDEDDKLRERFSGFVRKPFSQRELFRELADFLPRNPQKESFKENVAPEKKETVSANFAPAPNELISELRKLIIEPWPSIRDSVAVNESKTFAQGLEGLGQRWQCEPLVQYAQKLLYDAENYAVTDLEKHLGEFALLVEQLDGGAPK